MKKIFTHLLVALFCLSGSAAFVSAQAAVAIPTTASFNLDWSGDLFGNTAKAHGILTIDTALFPNPSTYTFLTSGVEITDFTLTVSGAAQGNGTFQLTDFDAFVWDSVVALDLSQELVGQQTGNGGWGTKFDGSTGDFSLIAALGSGAPYLAGLSFQLAAFEGAGEIMNLVSFRPVPIPAAFWLFGTALFGFAGLGCKRHA